MTRSLLAFGIVTLQLFGCGDDAPPPGPTCTDETSLLLECPETVVLSCVEPGSAAVNVTPRATACDGSEVMIECDPANGSALGVGEGTITCTARGGGQETQCAIPYRVSEDGAPMATCTDRVVQACSGVLTSVSVPSPTVDASCGALSGDLISDAPAGGFPIGESTVTFSGTGRGGEPVSCTTAVSVDDAVPPTVDCQANVRLVRSRADEPLAPPEATATDNCEGDLPVTATPLLIETGGTVVYAASDSSGNSASCDSEVTVVEAYAPVGVRILSAELDGRETHLTVGWDPGGGDVTGYAVERATMATGPFERLMETSSSARTFTDEGATDARVYYRVVSLAADGDGSASDPVEAHRIVSDQYILDDRSVPTVPFSTSLYGVVRYPEDIGDGPYPLAVLLHGNHGNCRRVGTTSDGCAQLQTHACTASGFTYAPNAEGLSYVAETLAAQGFVAVTISANALNCRDNWIEQRAQLIVSHLEQWLRWSSATGSPFMGTFVENVDLTRVALLGHSRGGEAVAHVPRVLRDTPRAGIALSSVLSLAPTEFDDPTPEDTPYAVILPGCDGDVSSFAGMRIYDRSIGQSDGNHKAQVLFAGANHNYFNTEWTGDDDRRGRVCASELRVDGAAQRGMLESVASSWMLRNLGSAAPEPFQRADAPTPESIDAWAGDGLDLRWSYTAGGSFIDDFEGTSAPGTNQLGEPNSFIGFSAANACGFGICDRFYGHRRTAVRVTWSDSATLSAGLGGMDLSGTGYLSFRAASTRSSANRGSGHTFFVRAVDGAGIESSISIEDLGGFPHRYPANAPFTLLRTVRVPIDLLVERSPTFDVSSVAEFQIQTEVGSSGELVFTDLTQEPR